MTRLTNHVREKMVTDLLNRRFEAQGKALASRSSALFVEVYEDTYDAETRRLMKQIEKRLKNAFVHVQRLELNVAGMQLSIGRVSIGSEKITFVPDVTPRPMLNNPGKFATYSDCPLAEKLRAFAQDQKTFCEEIVRAKREAFSALSSVTTAKQLSELWPEAMPIIGKHIPMASGSNVPAVQFAHLSKAFGLEPVVEGMAA
jgi:Nucleotide modification associated domain 5